MVACMGGWCLQRDTCRLYHAERAAVVSERLCTTGTTDSYEPVRVVRPVGTWERGGAALMSRATWDEVLP